MKDVMIEGRGIPLELVKKTIQHLQRASTIRIMFMTAALTGCRLTELQNMKKDLCREPYLIWALGKNQNGYRKELMPAYWWTELKEYRTTHKVPENRLFGPSGDTFGRMWDKARQTNLPQEWGIKIDSVINGIIAPAYKYQLRGLRKNFQTHIFAQQLRKWKDPTIALEITSKRMKHKSTHTTIYHYIQEYEILSMEKYTNQDMTTILRFEPQSKIAEYV